jgi:hypothetical protein
MAQIMLNNTALCLYNLSVYISDCAYCIITMGICIRESVYDTTEEDEE